MPKLPDTVRTKDPVRLAALRDLASAVGRHTTAAARESEWMHERNLRLTVAADAGASWADLARVAGISDVSVMQAVERFRRENPAYA